MADSILPTLLFSAHFVIWDYFLLSDAQSAFDDFYDPFIKELAKGQPFIIEGRDIL